ncbi:MAG TPA: DUF1543 domain-containing protein [Pirellulales bacterium]|jgi:hypothetical protein|nr:DUF1543 domain-containing protein [Pirellulales bacterium]
MADHSFPNDKLLAVYLGGRAPKCNTELHDVVFVVGRSIEATYEQLMDKWFGDPLSVHIDSWLELGEVDGHRVELRREPATAGRRLFFINLGAYRPGEFTELHANTFLVADDEREAKQRAKQNLLRGADSVHTDDLFDIDDCLEISQVAGRHVHLVPVETSCPIVPHNGYHVIPDEVVRAYAARRGLISMTGG